jgi:hypothetical protein
VPVIQETAGATVRLGPEHAAPVLESLSVVARKRALFAVDSYFRDSWEDLCELPPEDIEPILRHHALLLLKPDAVAGRRLHAGLDWLAERGTVVAAERVRLDRHAVRAMWQYQWNVASRDRRDLADLLGYDGGESLALFVRMPAHARPATVRLSEAKGPADPARRRPWQLRHRLGGDNFLLNFVHTADEPADLVREIGVLFDAPARRDLYRRLLRGADASDAARTAIAVLYDRLPARDLSLAGLVSGLRARSTHAGLTGALSAVDAGLNADWRGLCDLAEKAGAPLDAWDRAVVGTHLMVASEPTTVPILAGVPARDWDERPDPAILPAGWRAPGRVAHGGPAPRRTSPPALRYDQPVPRQLVHKAGIDEVMVTDSVQLTGSSYALAGELPLTHCHFTDLPGGGARFDLVALLELARQQAYVVTHRHLGVPLDRPFLLRRAGIELDRELVFAEQPDRLRVATTFVVERLFDAGLSGRLAFATPDGRPVGTATVSGSWSRPDEYRAMRAAARAALGLGPEVGPPPAVSADRVDPRRVGRTDPRNVLLTTAGEVAVDVSYRGMFDHAQDHVPGMLLIEAARQAALSTVPGGALRALSASFAAIAELDLPIHCGLDGTRATVRQNGSDVCRIDTTVEVPS